MISSNQIVLLILRDQIRKPRPGFRPELPGPAAIEPVELALCHQENTAQDQCDRPIRMGLRINQRQRRTPAAAKNNPLFNAQRFADAFNIRNQMPGGIVFNRRMRSRPAAAALIKQDDAVDTRIKIPPHRRACATAGTAMKHYNRHPVGIA